MQAYRKSKVPVNSCLDFEWIYDEFHFCVMLGWISSIHFLRLHPQVQSKIQRLMMALCGDNFRLDGMLLRHQLLGFWTFNGKFWFLMILSITLLGWSTTASKRRQYAANFTLELQENSNRSLEECSFIPAQIQICNFV